MNRVELVGRLATKPELRYLPDGTARTWFLLAVDRPFAVQEGQEKADFVPVTVWRKQAEACAQYLDRGRQVAVEGRLRTWTREEDGAQRRMMEVVADRVEFLSGGRRDEGAAEAPESMEFSEDDIPF